NVFLDTPKIVLETHKRLTQLGANLFYARQGVAVLLLVPLQRWSLGKTRRFIVLRFCGHRTNGIPIRLKVLSSAKQVRQLRDADRDLPCFVLRHQVRRRSLAALRSKYT